MIHELLIFLNWTFFCAVVLPTAAKQGSQFYKCFRALDIVYTKLWDKILFFCGIMSFFFRQWLNGTVKRVGKNTYELKVLICGEECRFIVEKRVPEIIDVQSIETNESYMDIAAPYVKYGNVKWIPPSSSIAYFENGTTEEMIVYAKPYIKKDDS